MNALQIQKNVLAWNGRLPLVGEMSEKDRKEWICLFLGLGTFLVFMPVLGFQFTNYDDPGYVIKNAHVTSGLSLDNLIWAFTALHGDISYWHPVTWLSHQLDCQIFGLSPGAHHLTNVLLHIASGLLLFLFFSRATGSLSRSAMVAALFCLHPLHVESVAWISERKDVLSGLFWMATLNVYAWYARAPTVRRHVAVSLLLALGLMSKPSVVTLPFVLLLLDYWPLGRFQEQTARLGRAKGCRLLVAEKLP